MTDKRDPAAEAFRELRKEWLSHRLLDHEHEREWESAAAEKARERENTKKKALFNKQTEEILQGRKHPVAPWCLMDMMSSQA